MLEIPKANEDLSFASFDCQTLAHLIKLIERILQKTSYMSDKETPSSADLAQLAHLIDDLWTQYRQKGYDCLYAYHDGNDLLEMLKNHYAKNGKKITSLSLAMVGMYYEDPLYDSLPLMSHYEDVFQLKYRESQYYATRADEFREYLFVEHGQRAVDSFNYYCREQHKQAQRQAYSLELVEELLKETSLSEEDSIVELQEPLVPKIPPIRFLNKSHEFTESLSPRSDFSSITPRRANRRVYQPILIEVDSLEEEESCLSSSTTGTPRMI